jgi:flagellar hook-length control protein FliK
MQSPSLPVQLTSASPAPSTPRNQGGQPDGGAQFSAALSREMVQQQPAPAPKSTPPAKAAAPQQAAKPAQADNAAKPASNDKAAEPAAPAKAADAAAQQSDEGADRAAADAAAAAAGNPLYELMAMVASFNQAPATPAPAAAALPATGAQPGIAVAPDAAALTAASARLSGLQAMPDVAPALPGADAPEAGFSNMMGKVDGAMQEGLEAAAAALGQPRPQPSVAAQGVPQERAPLADAKRDTGAVHGAPTPAPLAVTAVREALPEPVALKEAPVAAVTMAPVQQASLALPQAGAIQAADRIAARVGTPGWDNQVAQKIVWMVAGKEQSATLTLNPPDMGPMQVVLSVNNDQATVTFSAAQPEVRQALQDAMPKLREMMGESGIALGNASVHDGSANGQQQQARDEAQGSRNAGTASVPASGSAAEAEARMAARPARSGELPGLVNTFA